MKVERQSLRIDRVYCVWRTGDRGKPLQPSLVTARSYPSAYEVTHFVEVLTHGSERNWHAPPTTGGFDIKNHYGPSLSFEAFTSMEEALQAWRDAFKVWAVAEQSRLDKDIAEFNGIVRGAVQGDGGIHLTIERKALTCEEQV